MNLKHLGSGKMFALLWRDQVLLIGMVLVPIHCLRMTLSRNHYLQVLAVLQFFLQCALKLASSTGLGWNSKDTRVK